MARLPPLNLLQTIEAVVRLGSFKAAANELYITPSAVSHRIKSLEAMAGRLLFQREGQGVIPSGEAVELAGIIASANRQIEIGWDAVCRSATAHVYRLSCMSAFADHFIFSRIDDFAKRFPNVQLALTSSMDLDIALRQSPDLVIGFGPAPPHGWAVETIHTPMARAVAVQRIADKLVRDGKLFGPLLGFYETKDDWNALAGKIGYELHPDAQIIYFDSIASAVAAIGGGVGLAVVPEWVVADFEKEHEPLAHFGEPFSSPNGSYWLATGRGSQHLHIMEAIARWLRRSVAMAD